MMRALFLLYAIWGFNWVVMKTANAYFPPVLFVAFRFLIGAAVMLSACAWRRIPVPERKYWKWIAATGILQIAVNNVCMQIGMYSLTAGVVSVLNYTMPVWMAILAQLFLKERLTLRKIAGIAICIAGLFVLMDIHDLGNMTAVSIVLAGHHPETAPPGQSAPAVLGLADGRRLAPALHRRPDCPTAVHPLDNNSCRLSAL